MHFSIEVFSFSGFHIYIYIYTCTQPPKDITILPQGKQVHTVIEIHKFRTWDSYEAQATRSYFKDLLGHCNVAFDMME